MPVDSPTIDSPLVDSHCHLDFPDFADDLDGVVARAKDAGIGWMLTISTHITKFDQVRAVAEQFDNIWCSVGIHPHEAAREPEVDAVQLQTLADHSKVIGLGETGLDYFYDNADRAIQREVFRRQLQIACDNDRPVVIHSRDADEDTIAILKEFELSLKRRGVIHSFTSGPGLARYALDQGWNLGFNGITTFNKAENVRDIVRMAPISQILLETDAPFLTPVPYRGRENAPFYLPFVAEKIAEVKELPLEEVIIQTYQNSLRTFFPAQ